ncbi:MAG: hypothetical protein ACR2NZ_14515 [Rubripirellula sp.]
MNIDDDQAKNKKPHRGHDLESGLLSRFREWVDVLPWIRLGRTMRAVASPPLLLMVAATFFVWRVGESQILGIGPIESFLTDDMLSLRNDSARLARFIHQTNATSVYDLGVGVSWWQVILGLSWTVVVWAPAGILLTRQGGCLTAGRPMMSFQTGLALAVRRSPAAWLSSFVPLACVFAMTLLIAAFGWMSRWLPDVRAIEAVFALLSALIAIPCGILAFGANVAVPLSWSAIANEEQPDTLDSLSRGYEYLFRRPLQLVGYVVVALFILWVVRLLASGVAIAAIAVATNTLMFCNSPMPVVEMVSVMLAHLPAVALLTSLWSLIGGIYLLLRYDAGGQEVEDLWLPDPVPSTPLPQVPT